MREQPQMRVFVTRLELDTTAQKDRKFAAVLARAANALVDQSQLKLPGLLLLTEAPAFVCELFFQFKTGKQFAAARVAKFAQLGFLEPLQPRIARFTGSKKIDAGALRLKGNAFAVGGEAFDSLIVHERAQFAQGPAERSARIVRYLPEEFAQRVAPLRRSPEDQVSQERARLSRLGQREKRAAASNRKPAE